MLIKASIILSCGNTSDIKGRSQPLLRPSRSRRGYQRSPPPPPQLCCTTTERATVCYGSELLLTASCKVFDLRTDLRANHRPADVTASRGISLGGALLERWRRRACKFGPAHRSLSADSSVNERAARKKTKRVCYVIISRRGVLKQQAEVLPLASGGGYL